MATGPVNPASRSIVIFISWWQWRLAITAPKRGPTSVPTTGRSSWATNARIARASSGGAPVAIDHAVALLAVAVQHVERDRQQPRLDLRGVGDDVAVDQLVEVAAAVEADRAGPHERPDADAARRQERDHRREHRRDQQRQQHPPPRALDQPREQVAAGIAVVQRVVEVEHDQRRVVGRGG